MLYSAQAVRWSTPPRGGLSAEMRWSARCASACGRSTHRSTPGRRRGCEGVPPRDGLSHRTCAASACCQVHTALVRAWPCASGAAPQRHRRRRRSAVALTQASGPRQGRPGAVPACRRWMQRGQAQPTERRPQTAAASDVGLLHAGCPPETRGCMRVQRGAGVQKRSRASKPCADGPPRRPSHCLACAGRPSSPQPHTDSRVRHRSCIWAATPALTWQLGAKPVSRCRVRSGRGAARQRRTADARCRAPRRQSGLCLRRPPQAPPPPPPAAPCRTRICRSAHHSTAQRLQASVSPALHHRPGERGNSTPAPLPCRRPMALQVSGAAWAPNAAQAPDAAVLPPDSGAPAPTPLAPHARHGLPLLRATTLPRPTLAAHGVAPSAMAPPPPPLPTAGAAIASVRV
jgi:hypothetical protein